MANEDKKITELSPDTSPTADDLLILLNDPGGTPGEKKVTVGDFKDAMYGGNFIDSSQADQGIDTPRSVKHYVNEIGTSQSATLLFVHDGSGDTTTYTFSTSVTIPSNIRVIREEGAILHFNDGVTLTQNGPFESPISKAFTWTGTGKIIFGSDAIKEAHPELWYFGTGAWATAVQAALTAVGDGKTKLLPDKTYAFDGFVIMPHRSIFDITGAYITSTTLPVIKASTAGTILGYGADIFSTATVGGAAIEALDNTGVCGLNIYGHPHIHLATTDVADSIGVDASSFYKTYIEVSLQNWKTPILYSGEHATCYYNTLQSPIIRGGVLSTGIKAKSVSGLTINSPFISGGDVGLYGIHLDGAGSVTIVGGYSESFKEDNVAVRGLLIHDSSNIVLINHIMDSASTVANFAMGITGTSTQIDIISPTFSGAWATSTKLIDFTSGGKLNLLGGSYVNAFLFDQTTLPTLRDGYVHMKGIDQKGSSPANYCSTFENTSTTGEGVKVTTASTNIIRSSLYFKRAVDGVVIDMAVGGSPRPGIYIGSGSPEGVHAARPGSIYLNVAGGANVSIYVKEAGTGNTGWIAK